MKAPSPRTQGVGPRGPWLLPRRKQKALSLTRESRRDTANPKPAARRVAPVKPPEPAEGSKAPAGALGPALAAAPPSTGGLSHRPRGPEAEAQPPTFRRELLELVVLLQETQVYRLLLL